MGSVGGRSIPKNANPWELTDEQIRGDFAGAIRLALKDVDRMETITNPGQAYNGIYELAGVLSWGFSDDDLNKLGKLYMGASLGDWRLRSGIRELLDDSNFHTEVRLLEEADDKIHLDGVSKREAFKPYFDHLKDIKSRPRF